LVSPLFGDFDGDEKLDVAVAFEAVIPLKIEGRNDLIESWLATGLIYGSGKRGFASGKWVADQSNFLNLGNLVYLPQGLFRIGKCNRFAFFQEHNGLRMLSVPRATGACRDLGSERAPFAIRPGTAPT
jgi:hypothetical protein